MKSRSFLLVIIGALLGGCATSEPATWDDFAASSAEAVSTSALGCELDDDPCAYASDGALGACLGTIALTSVEHEAVRLDVEMTSLDRARAMPSLDAVSETAASLTAAEIKVTWSGRHRAELTRTIVAGEPRYEGIVTLRETYPFHVSCRPATTVTMR